MLGKKGRHGLHGVNPTLGNAVTLKKYLRSFSPFARSHVSWGVGRGGMREREREREREACV